MHVIVRHLVLHAALILTWGLLLGAPYGRAIQRGAASHIVNSWRVAHASLPIGAILMLAVAALLPALAPPPALETLVIVALVASGWAFAVSTPLAAITGQRGLARGGSGLGHLVYLGNMVGAATSLVAAVGLVAAAWLSL